VTEHVYCVPFVSPVTVAVRVVPLTETDWAPVPSLVCAQVAVYPVTALPLGLAAVHVTTSSVSPGVATTFDGAPGFPLGMVGEAEAAGPVPLALVAVTEQVYWVPSVRPVTVAVNVFPSTPVLCMSPLSLVLAHEAV
jgi:hypothetical protein